jgi:hypothetical protein
LAAVVVEQDGGGEGVGVEQGRAVGGGETGSVLRGATH